MFKVNRKNSRLQTPNMYFHFVSLEKCFDTHNSQNFTTTYCNEHGFYFNICVESLVYQIFKKAAVLFTFCSLQSFRKHLIETIFNKVISFYFTKYQLRRTYLMSTFFQGLNLKSCLIRASQQKQEKMRKFSRLVYLIQPESFIRPYLIFGIICGGGSDHQMNLPTDSQS